MSEQRKYNYRLLTGTHAETAHTYETLPGGELKETGAKTTVYRQGDCFESENEFLVEKHGKDKFEKLSDNYDLAVHAAAQAGKGDTPAANPSTAGAAAQFSDWTIEELKAYAVENEIPLGNVTKKADIIGVLAAHV